ncbi:MAG: efflux RND transporter periplasmic adaptor subunit [Methyloprofundus sp.]|nr:efflux RND transporter periplasmic adaptor subunit [Methyloprofundus sp.]MDT8426143.1 efflux RND transporter periplasmic adaptor subunit [Methyloprofundus sp.]
MKAIYKILLLLVFLCLLAGLFLFFPSKPENKPSVQNIGENYFTGPFKIQVVINPEQPKVGHNQLQILLLNKDNEAVTNATIKAVAEMPAMGSMPTMYAPAEIINKQKGLYQGQFEIPMMGAWPLTISIEAGAQGQAEISFDMGTSRKGLTLSSATPSTFAVAEDRQQRSTELQSKTFTVDAYRRQLIGVRTQQVTCIQIIKTLQASAIVTYDETKLTDINLKFDGWIEQLNADFVGKQVAKGEPLFSVYSPVLISLQDEYLQSLQRHQAGLKSATVRRLSLLDINQEQIRAIGKRGRSIDVLPILSPINGTIIEKNIVSGSAFKAGTKLLTLADLSSVWVEGEVYAEDLPSITIGMSAQVFVDDTADQPLLGVVSFIEPVLNNATRTARVRIQLANPEGLLRPEQYVRLQLQLELGPRLVVPREAVVFSGKNRIVFLDLGEGRLQARKINTGESNEAFIEVLDGLSPGDLIVSSGNFLIASESKMKSGSEQW